jgi:hypothetical protein
MLGASSARSGTRGLIVEIDELRQRASSALRSASSRLQHARLRLLDEA